jgi:hypothetical protein
MEGDLVFVDVIGIPGRHVVFGFRTCLPLRTFNQAVEHGLESHHQSRF